MKEWLKPYALFLLPLFLQVGGCANSNEVDKNMLSDAQGAQRFSENEEVFFELQHSKIYAVNKGSPATFYVRGHIHNGNFVPEGDVLGDGALAVDGQSGWLEFADAHFHPTPEGRTPNYPLVYGRLTQNGFVPSSRQITWKTN